MASFGAREAKMDSLTACILAAVREDCTLAATRLLQSFKWAARSLRDSMKKNDIIPQIGSQYLKQNVLLHCSHFFSIHSC